MAEEQTVLVPIEQFQLDLILSIVSVIAALAALGISVSILMSAQRR